jgi:hypothetical protein
MRRETWQGSESNSRANLEKASARADRRKSLLGRATNKARFLAPKRSARSELRIYRMHLLVKTSLRMNFHADWAASSSKTKSFFKNSKTEQQPMSCD